MEIQSDPKFDDKNAGSKFWRLIRIAEIPIRKYVEGGHYLLLIFHFFFNVAHFLNYKPQIRILLKQISPVKLIETYNSVIYFALS